MLNQKQQNRFSNLSNIVSSGGSLRPGQQKRYDRLSGMQNGQGGLPSNPVKQTGAVQTNILNTFDDNFSKNSDSMFGPIDFSALPAAPNTQDLAGERKRIEDELYGKYTRDFDSQKAQDTQAFDQKMAERGITPGSGEAYSNAYKDFENSWNDRYDEAKSRATTEGGQEWERAFNIGTSGRANSLNEQAFSKTFPMQQLTSLMSMGSQVAGMNQGFRNIKSNNRNQKANRRLQKQLTEMNNAAMMDRLLTQLNFSGGGGSSAPPSPPPPPPSF